MAAKRKTNLPAKAENKALAQGGSWEERMKAMSEQAAEREPLTGGGQWLSVRNGDFHYGDDVLGDAINVVVLDFSFDNAYYGGRAFDPDVRDSPDCFAIGMDEEELAPHEDSPEPQADTCAECWANEFKSDNRGRGKACKNSRRLALVAVDEADGFTVADDSEMAFLRLSPASLKYWKSYVAKLTRVTGLPPAGVVTRLELEPIPNQSGSLIKPVLVQEIEDAESHAALMTLLDSLGDSLLQPYKAAAEEEAPKPARGGRRAPAKKAPAKKAPAAARRTPRKKF